MRGSRTAIRYAKSLFDLALELNKLDAINADMQLVENTCKQNPELVTLLNSPIVTSDTKKAALTEIFAPKVDSLTISFINITIDKGRESGLSAIAAEFAEMYDKYKGIVQAYLTTATPADAETEAKILEMVKAKTGMQVELTKIVDEQIMGGFVLRFGDNQIDSSVATQVRNLEKTFSKNLYVKDF